jgi:ABC-type sugar transport system permease subunit
MTSPLEKWDFRSLAIKRSPPGGGGGWRRFRYVTLPLLRPIILIVTLFSVIFTFADFRLVYVLTHGGPQNATQLFATYAFDIAMGAGQSSALALRWRSLCCRHWHCLSSR